MTAWCLDSLIMIDTVNVMHNMLAYLIIFTNATSQRLYSYHVYEGSGCQYVAIQRCHMKSRKTVRFSHIHQLTSHRQHLG